ncbi:MAG: hypothetical protein J0M12_13060 [Deltaproteobacteria bacterium]|nr:hypothetical protein [Deltaproteobacteria bacterium]
MNMFQNTPTTAQNGADVSAGPSETPMSFSAPVSAGVIHSPAIREACRGLPIDFDALAARQLTLGILKSFDGQNGIAALSTGECEIAIQNSSYCHVEPLGEELVFCPSRQRPTVKSGDLVVIKTSLNEEGASLTSWCSIGSYMRPQLPALQLPHELLLEAQFVLPNLTRSVESDFSRPLNYRSQAFRDDVSLILGRALDPIPATESNKFQLASIRRDFSRAAWYLEAILECQSQLSLNPQSPRREVRGLDAVEAHDNIRALHRAMSSAIPGEALFSTSQKHGIHNAFAMLERAGHVALRAMGIQNPL